MDILVGLALQLGVTYHFSPLVRKSYIWLILVSLVVSVIIVYLRLPEVYEGQPITAMFKLIVAVTFPITLLFRLVFVVRPFIYASYSPESTCLIIRRGGSEERIDYGQIQEVRWSWLPMFLGGGLILKLKSGQLIRIYSLIDGYENIIQHYIDFLPSNLVPRPLESFERRAQFLRDQRQRILSVIKKWKTILVVYFVVPWGLAYVDHVFFDSVFERSVSAGLILWSIGILLAATFWWVEEKLLYLKGSGDLKTEKTVHWSFRALYVLILVLITLKI